MGGIVASHTEDAPDREDGGRALNRDRGKGGRGHGEGADEQGVVSAVTGKDAKCKVGDVIVKVAGQPVRNVAELLTQVASLKPGVQAEVNVWRRQGEVNLRLTPAERPPAGKPRK